MTLCCFKNQSQWSFYILPDSHPPRLKSRLKYWAVWIAGVFSEALSIRNMLSLLVVNSGLHSGFPDSLLSLYFSFHPFPCGIKINGVVWKLKAWVRQFITASAVQQQRHSNEWVALISLEIYGNQMVVWVNHSTEKQPARFYLALYGWYWIFLLYFLNPHHVSGGFGWWCFKTKLAMYFFSQCNLYCMKVHQLTEFKVVTAWWSLSVSASKHFCFKFSLRNCTPTHSHK